MIAGKKSIVLKAENQLITCPNCNHPNTISLKILGDYGHLFHIPFISKGKRGEAHCSNCNQILKHHEMKNDLKLAYFLFSALGHPRNFCL